MRASLLGAAVAGGVLGLWGAVAPAGAVVAPGTTSQYVFSGVCTDCAGTVSGTLTLLNYAEGSAVTPSNFVSFAYGGSDLIPFGFTIINDGDLNVGGSLAPPFPGTEGFFVYGTIEGSGLHQLFETFGDGRWCTGYSCVFAEDYGPSSSWARFGEVAAVPEPGSLAVLVGALAGVGVVRRRRRLGVG